MSDHVPEEFMPDRRKHGYREIEEKLEKHYADLEQSLADHAESLEDRLSGFFTKALIVFAILGMTSAGSLFGFGIVLKVIQNQRYEASFQNCQQQNLRHDNAVAKAKRVFPEETQAGVIEVLDALQPFIRNCDKQARNRVKGDEDGK